MNTRDFVLVGAGAVVGYLLVGIINKNKGVLGNNSTGLPDTSSQTVPPAIVGGDSSSNQAQPSTGQEVLVDPKLALCEENWVNYSKTKRFASEEQAKMTKNNFITNCLARIQ